MNGDFRDSLEVFHRRFEKYKLRVVNHKPFKVFRTILEVQNREEKKNGQ